MEFIAHIPSIDNPRRALCQARGDILLMDAQSSYPQCACCWELHQAHEARKKPTGWLVDFMAHFDNEPKHTYVAAGAPRLPKVGMESLFTNHRTFLRAAAWVA